MLRTIGFFFRLVQRKSIYYLISAGGLTVGITAFLFIAVYVGYELSYDRSQTNADRLYRVAFNSARTPVPLAPAMRKDIAGVENSARVIFSMTNTRFIVRDSKDNVFEEWGYFVDSTFFDVFSYRFVGTAPSKPLRSPDQIVITQQMAKKYFGDDDPVGKTLSFANANHELYTVAGVIEDLPPNSQFNFSFVMPFSEHGASTNENWNATVVYTYLLLEPDADASLVLLQLKNMMTERAQMDEAKVSETRLQPFRDLHFDSTAVFDHGSKNKIENLWILSSIAVLILIIAGINFINLSTARVSDRMKEVSMKKILGASRHTLIAQFLSEAMIIAVFSCALSVILALALKSSFESVTGVGLNYGWDALGIYRWLLITLPLVIGLSAGIYPAMVISSAIPVKAMKGSTHIVRSPLRTALVVVQFSISAFLIIGTGVIVSQMKYMQNKDLGFDNELAVVLNVGGPGIGHRIDVASKLFAESSDVVSTSGTLTLPGDNTYTMAYSPLPSIMKDEDRADLAGFYVDPDFVGNMGIEVIKGRSFSKDVIADTANFILNEAAVQKLKEKYGVAWNEPVGQKLNYFLAANNTLALAKSGTVIGVVKDFNFASLHHAIQPMAIQVDYNAMYKLIVKIKPTNIPSTMKFLESKWKELGIVRPFNYQFLDDKILAAYERESRFQSMFLMFAVLSIVISCVGLYGLVLYATERRSREMSIRKILGARAYDLVMLVGTSFFKPVLIALLIACPLAWYSMNQWLSQFAFKEDVGVSIFFVAGGLCASLAVITVLSRVLKVSRTNPVKYLKED